MRGNPLVNLAAILVMLASVLVGGHWLSNKQEQSREILQLPEKVDNKSLTFEKAVKETEE